MGKFKKIFAGILSILIVLAGLIIVTPADNSHAFNLGGADLSSKCTPGEYGKTASSDDGLVDMTCTIYNLATGRPGKLAAIALMVFGFVRAGGLGGQGGGIVSAILPFTMGVGLANVDGLANSVGYDFY